jgi:NAD-dependent SIR2 family protein deacetylase
MIAGMKKYIEEAKIKPGNLTCTKCGTNLTGNEVDNCKNINVVLMCQYCLADNK